MTNIMRLFYSFLIFAVLSSTVCAARSFIIDTDAANDDAVAILYLLARPDIDVKAITIATTGEAHCDAAYQNIQGLIEISHHAAIPLACGREQPIAGHHQFPDWIRNAADDLYGMAASLPKTSIPNNLLAINVLTKTLYDAAQPIDILAIGPLTNIADVMQQHPELKSKIHHIYIMGGAVHVPGNVGIVEKSIDNFVAEWNFYIDPTAADIVFKSHVPVTLISLDVTNQLPIDQAFYQRLTQAKVTTPVAHFIFRLFDENKQKFLKLGWYFWDPTAAVIASDESIGTYKTEKLRVITAEGNTSGSIVEDKVNGNDITLTLQVPVDKFYTLALGALMDDKTQMARS